MKRVGRSSYAAAPDKGMELTGQTVTSRAAMSAYKDALVLGPSASDERVALAAEMLASGAGVVLLEGILALRSMGSELLCEVIDPTPSAHRCANEYEVLVENARLALEGSKLGTRLPNWSRQWLVVEDYGTGTMELWRAP